MHPVLDSNIQAIIFDHDGTLVDSEPVHLSCWQSVLQPFAVTLSHNQYSFHLSGVPSMVSAQWMVKEFNLDVPPATLLENKKLALKNALSREAFPLMPEAAKVVQQLAARYPMAIASGAGRAEVHRSITFHNLVEHFQFVCTQDDVKNNKPSPDVYLLAADRLGIAPKNCLAIEDSDTGQASAEAAGMACLRLVRETMSVVRVTQQSLVIRSLLEIVSGR